MDLKHTVCDHLLRHSRQKFAVYVVAISHVSPIYSGTPPFFLSIPVYQCPRLFGGPLVRGTFPIHCVRYSTQLKGSTLKEEKVREGLSLVCVGL